MACGCMKDKKKVETYLQKVKSRKLSKGYTPTVKERADGKN